MPSSTDVRILRAALWAARHRSRVATPPKLEDLLERAFYRRGYSLHYRVGGQGQQAFPSLSGVRNSGKQQGHLKWITIGGADEGDQRHVTKTKAFKDWFGDSKVVNEDGSPMVVYHGTKSDFDSFDAKKSGTSDEGLFGKGFYFTYNPEEASSSAVAGYYGNGDAANVKPVYVSLKRPFVIKHNVLPDGRTVKDMHGGIGITAKGSSAIRKLADEGGHDGIILENQDGKVLHAVAFHPNQIKSATGNRGTFDRGDDRIQFSASGGRSQSIQRRTYTTFRHPQPGHLDLRRLALHAHDRPHEGSHVLVETYKDELHRTLVPDEATGLAALARRVKELKQAGWRQSEKYQHEEANVSQLETQLAAAFHRRGYVERYAGPLATPVIETLAKVSQAKANYKPAFGSARCGACAHYRAHACEIVAGQIEPDDVCDFFTPERENVTERISEQYRRRAAAEQLGHWVETYAKRKPASGQHHLWTEADEEKHPRAADGTFGAGGGGEKSDTKSGNAIALQEPKDTIPDSGQQKGPPASETAAARSNLEGGQTMDSVADASRRIDPDRQSQHPPSDFGHRISISSAMGYSRTNGGKLGDSYVAQITDDRHRSSKEHRSTSTMGIALDYLEPDEREWDDEQRARKKGKGTLTAHYDVPANGGLYKIREQGDTAYRVFFPLLKAAGWNMAWKSLDEDQLDDSVDALESAGLRATDLPEAMRMTSGIGIDDIVERVKAYAKWLKDDGGDA